MPLPPWCRCPSATTLLLAWGRAGFDQCPPALGLPLPGAASRKALFMARASCRSGRLSQLRGLSQQSRADEFGTTEPGISAERFSNKVYFFHSWVPSLRAPGCPQAGHVLGIAWPHSGTQDPVVLSRTQWGNGGPGPSTGLSEPFPTPPQGAQQQPPPLEMTLLL